ncbi:MAG TPA: hypothetical protein VFS47_07365 [Steroidobacteraceae bacterium]|nr:hypothetical protein [Steroidobacteraceae bacterium]
MRRVTVGLAALAASALFAITASAADNTAMHMHKSEMRHDRPDKEVASDYKNEADQLKEQAASHRKLAEQYRQRSPQKGGGNYENVAKHCDKLAEYYEKAAQEAEAISGELSK